MVFLTGGFFEVAIESWPEWDLNPRPLNSVQIMNQAINSTRTQSQLCTATPISSFVQFHISFRLLPSSVATYIVYYIFYCYFYIFYLGYSFKLFINASNLLIPLNVTKLDL